MKFFALALALTFSAAPADATLGDKLLEELKRNAEIDPILIEIERCRAYDLATKMQFADCYLRPRPLGCDHRCMDRHQRGCSATQSEAMMRLVKSFYMTPPMNRLGPQARENVCSTGAAYLGRPHPLASPRWSGSYLADGGKRECRPKVCRPFSDKYPAGGAIPTGIPPGLCPPILSYNYPKGGVPTQAEVSAAMDGDAIKAALWEEMLYCEPPEVPFVIPLDPDPPKAD